MLIYKFVKYEKVRSLFCKKKLENSESMFIFRFLNCMIFYIDSDQLFNFSTPSMIFGAYFEINF